MSGAAGFLDGFASGGRMAISRRDAMADRELRKQEIEAADRASERSLEAARLGRGLPGVGGGYEMPGRLSYGSQSSGRPATSAAGLAPVTSTGLIAEFEGFREQPYWDVNAHRVGFGSDTITRADGSVVRVTPDMRVSREDAQRDLDRRLSSEFTPSIMKAVGQDTWSGLNPSQQAVLNSLAYNYGAHAWDKGLAPVRSALTSGGDVAAAIRSLGSHNNGVNEKRRNREADLWGAGSPRLSQAKPAEPTRKPTGRKVAGAANGPWSTFRSIIQ